MRSKALRLSRRSMLRGLGAALPLPFLEAMGDSGGGALPKGPPLRFATVFHPNGVFPAAWDVKGTGKNFEFSRILKPLEPLRNDVTIISNLDNVGVAGHVEMTGSFLTGVGLKKARDLKSLDLMFAEKVGANTALPAVQFGTEPPRQGTTTNLPIAYANTVTWNGKAGRLNPEINPQVAFDRMFRTADTPAARRAAEGRKSVIDLVLDDAKSLRRKAGNYDQQKIDEYLDGVRSVERQIERSLNPPPRDWEPLTKPKLERPPAGIPRKRDVHLRLMIDLMVLGFWTDTTRVGTLMTAHGFSRQNFSFLDGVNGDHHGMSHHKNKPQSVKEYTIVSTWYASQFAYLLKRMKSIDEGNGSLLDNSVVLYGSGMKDGNGHVRKNLPIVLAGRAQGALRPGQHVRLKQGTPYPNLLLTLAQKLGLEMDEFNGVGKNTLDLDPV